jgi:CRISPR-associated protein Csm1
VPAASWKSDPDISLYDHLRVTAALAACIEGQNPAILERWEEQTARGVYPDEPVALLVGGDLSGIQQFLYSVSSHGAIRSLRGRSAYLSLVAEAAARLLLRELALPPTQVVYNSGGHFYFLAPLSCRDALAGIARQVTEALLRAHGGDLTLTLDAVELRGTDLDVRIGALATRWTELGGRLADRKAQRFRELLPAYHSRIVGPFDTGGQAQRCDVCHGEEAELEPGLRRDVREEEDGTRKCSLCASFEELGTTLARHPQWVSWVTCRRPRARALAWHTVLATLGFEVFFESRESPPPHEGCTLRVHSASVDGEDLRLCGFRWLPAYTPLEPYGSDASRLSIADLHQISQRAEGAHYWACLRMDVDHLGMIFSQGLTGRYSLSRVATLSRMLGLFFEGYLPDLVAVSDNKQPGLYLVYAGGDDLLLVGRWDNVVEMAGKIRGEFMRFAAENPSLTLSAGITLHRAKYPLYQAADDAGDALDSAKTFHHPDGHTKNAIAFLGTPVSWDHFMWLRQWKDSLYSLFKSARAETKLSRNFLQKLKSIADLAGEAAEILRAERQTTGDVARMAGLHKARWRLVYTLTREPEGALEPLGVLQSELLEEPGRMALLRLLARWLELLTREERWTYPALVDGVTLTDSGFADHLLSNSSGDRYPRAECRRLRL